MKRCAFFVLLIAVRLPLAGQNPPAPASPRMTIQDSLPFATEGDGIVPKGWYINPPATIHLDGQVVHSGPWSVRIDRSPSSQGNFSVITRTLPVDFAGGYVELRGYIRTKDVTAGYAGLWLREDGQGEIIKIENMANQHVDGTHDWSEYSVKLPIDNNARQLLFGALLGGNGTMWVDDLRLLVDGKPIAKAEPMDRPLSALDGDHEFDKGSKVQLTSLAPGQVDNLVTLGRVWGFLKYHHPVVTEGKRQWDYDLLRILPKILAAPDSTHENEILVHWIDSLGEIPSCKAEECTPAPAQDVYLKPDIEWIRDRATLGSELSMRLQRIYQIRPQRSQFYVNISFHSPRNASFNHELSYPNVTFPDAGFQLLALFRWWNIMQYWAPYRVDAGQNWPAVLAEFIPKLALAKDSTAYQLALFELIAEANDTHANLWSSIQVRPPVGKCTLPVEIRFIDGKAVVTGLTGVAVPDSPLHIGDIIDSLNGSSIAELTEQWTPYYADSNVAARRRDMARLLLYGDCGSVSVQVIRQGKPIQLRADRQPPQGAQKPWWHDLPGDTFQMLSPDLAYLKLSSIKARDIPAYMERAANTKGMVIDIRNYPSEFVPFALGQYLVSRPTQFAAFTAGDLGNPGAFRFVDNADATIEPAASHYKGKVVILVDEMSQSSAEYTAMALRAAPGAIVVGSTTAGADGNVSDIPLPGGLSTMISGIGVFYPNHVPTQRIGIVPDVESKPTIEGIKAGRDEVLETAIRQIFGPSIPQATIERLAKPTTDPQATPTM